MKKEQRKKVIAKMTELEQILIINNPQRAPSTIGDDVSDEALLVFLGIIVGQVSNVMAMHPAFTHRMLHELGITVTKEKDLPADEPDLGEQEKEETD